MNLDCDAALALDYKSESQRARILTESWVERNGFCLACDADCLARSAANTPFTDFICPECRCGYELKAFRNRPARRLIDGAYHVLLARILRGDAPVLLLLNRSERWRVMSFSALHPMFLTPDMIEKRKPLSNTARRAGWIGCSIRMDLMGPDAEIPIVTGGVVLPRSEPREAFRRLQEMAKLPIEERGWTNLVLRILRERFTGEFSLQEVYTHKALFAAAYPQNAHVESKIRQQLQVLRDLGLIVFSGRGRYMLRSLKSAR